MEPNFRFSYQSGKRLTGSLEYVFTKSVSTSASLSVSGYVRMQNSKHRTTEERNMKRSSILTIALAATTALTTAAWAQHGAGAVGHGGAAGPPSFAGVTSSHGSNGSGHQDANSPNTGSGRAADFESRLASNPNLSSRLQALLPPNTTLADAAMGFKNQGQFIAALHVSHNLGIDFNALKMDMLTSHDSLGTAIKALRPDLSTQTVKTDVKDAERQAKNDVQEANEVAENGGK
jgi:hypothetical protein